MKLNKLKLKNNILVFIVVSLSIIGLFCFSSSFGIYSSSKESTAKIDLAYSLVEVDDQEKNLSLSNILPDNKERYLIISVSNFTEDKIIDINMKYNIKIKTTTNLPIKYNLYDENDNLLSTNNELLRDEYGTIFYSITTDSINITYDKKITNIYKIGYTLDDEYATEEYQDIIELLSVSINAEQM